MIIHLKDSILFETYVWGKNLLTADIILSNFTRFSFSILQRQQNCPVS